MAGQYNIQFVADTSKSDSRIKESIRYMQDLNAYVRRLGGTFEIAEKEDIEFVKSLGQLSSSATSAKGRVREMSNAINEMRIFYMRMTDAEQKAPIGMAMSQSIREAQQTLKVLKNEMESVGQSSSRGGLFGSFFFTKGMIAYRAVMGTIQFAKQTVQNAVQTNMDFEQSNATLYATLGKTKDQIIELTSNALKLGATTVWTAKQITDLQTTLARRGFDDSQILHMTKGISSLAIATGIDLTQAAEIAGSTMQAFGLRAINMNDIVATLGVATTKSALTMEKLKVSLGYVARSASAAGFSLEETVAMLGVLADSGLPASTAGTSLRTVLVNLSSESSKLSKALGHPVHNLNELVDALQELKEKGGDNLNYISSIIDKRAIASFDALLANTDKLKEMRDKISDVKDELQDMADKMQNTFAGSIKLFRSAWDGLMVSFGEGSGPLRDVVDLFTSLINKITELRRIKQGGQNAVMQFVKGANEETVKHNIEFFLKRNNGKGKEAYKDAVDFYSKDIKDYEEAIKELEEWQAKYDEANNKLRKGVSTNNVIIQQQASGEIDNFDKDFSKLLKEWRGSGVYAKASSVFGLDGIKDIHKLIARLKDGLSTINLTIETLKPLNNKRGDLEPETEEDKKSYSPDFIKLGHERWDYSEEGIANWIREAQKQTSVSDPNSEEFKSWYAQGIDMKSLQGLFGVAKQNNMGDVLEGLKEQFDAIADNAQDITKESWEKIVEKINDRLKKMDLPEIELDYTTGSVKNKSKKIERDNIDNKILNGLMSIARGNKIGYGSVGIGGQKDRIKDGIDIPDKEWNDIADKMNDELNKRGVTWYIDIDFETGTIERLKTRIQEVMEALGSGTGGIKSIVSALDSVKKAGENMIDTLQGDADGWDKMMAVFNAAISPMEAMVTIYEAINALKAMFSMLSTKNSESQIQETASTVAGVQAEVAAEFEKVAADKLATKSAMELATAGFLAAHASIPFAGFEIGSGFAEGALALTKANGIAALAFHDGGIVPGAYNGGRDTVPALLSPGEIILNRAQQNTLAPQLQPASEQASPMSTPYVTGEYIWLGLNNWLARTGKGEIVTTRR